MKIIQNNDEYTLYEDVIRKAHSFRFVVSEKIVIQNILHGVNSELRTFNPLSLFINGIAIELPKILEKGEYVVEFNGEQYNDSIFSIIGGNLLNIDYLELIYDDYAIKTLPVRTTPQVLPLDGQVKFYAKEDQSGIDRLCILTSEGTEKQVYTNYDLGPESNPTFQSLTLESPAAETWIKLINSMASFELVNQGGVDYFFRDWDSNFWFFPRLGTVTMATLNGGQTFTSAIWNGTSISTTYTDAKLASLNGLVGPTQTFAVGSTGSAFNIVSSGTTHTFHLPPAGASAAGVVTTASQTFAGAKTFSSPTIYMQTALYLGTSSSVNGILFFYNSTNSFTTQIRATDATGARILDLPNASGTIALTSDISYPVTSVSGHSNGTLTISPTTGAVIAGLNLNNANTWTALQTHSLAGLTMQLTNTTDNSNVQVLRLDGDRATTADNDRAYWSGYISNNNNEQVEIARMTWQITDRTDNNESGNITFHVMDGGAVGSYLKLAAAGLSPSSDAGIDLGTSTLRWSTFYLKNYIVQDEVDANIDAASLDANDSIAIYNKANKFVIAYNNVGTITYVTIPLDGSTTTWTHSTTAP